MWMARGVGTTIRATRSSSWRRTRAAATLLPFLIILTGCASAHHPVPIELGEPSDPCANPAEQQKVATLLAQRQRLPSSEPGYSVAPGDVLGVTVYNYRPGGGDFSSDVRVDDRGNVSLPMMDPVHVAGLSVAQTRQALIRGLQQADVLKEPLVSVFVKDYRGQEVIVLGGVGSPGVYHLSRGKQTLIDVLSLAGGLSEKAGNVLFLRPMQHAESSAASALPFEEEPGNVLICLDKETGEPEPLLMTLRIRGGDLIIVPDAGKAYIDGEVDRPGPYPLTRGMTLTQLISTAGGTTFPADPTRVRVIRRATDGERAQWEVSLVPTETDVQPDIRLARNDHVVVPYTLPRKTAYSLYKFVVDIVRITIGGAVSIF